MRSNFSFFFVLLLIVFFLSCSSTHNPSSQTDSNNKENNILPIKEMWTLFEDDFESADLSKWSDIVGNTLTVDKIAAYEGEYGLNVGLANSENYIYKSGMNNNSEGYLTFSFNPNNANLDSSIVIANIKESDDWKYMIGLRVFKIDGAYKAYMVWHDSNGDYQFDWIGDDGGEALIDLISGWQEITISYKTNNWIAVETNYTGNHILDIRNTDRYYKTSRQLDISNGGHYGEYGTIIEIGETTIRDNIDGSIYFDNVSYNINKISDLWVDAINGDDSNDGLTSSNAFKSIQKAADIAGPGTTVHIKSGTYNEHIIPQYLGENPYNEYTIYQAEAGENVIIDGNGISLEWYGLFDIRNKNYIKVSGLGIENSPWAGFYVEKSEYIIIENNYTNCTNSSGIYIERSNNLIVDNNKIRYAVQSKSQECISIVECNEFEIKYNEVYDGVELDAGEGINIKTSGDTTGICSNGTIHHNYVHDLKGDVGIYIGAYKTGTVVSNIDVYCNITTTPIGIAVSSEQGGLTEDIYIYNNLAYNCGEVGIQITDWVLPNTGPKRNIRIINNTIYNCGNSTSGGGIYIESRQDGDEDFVIRNNIISQNVNYQLLVRQAALDNLIAEYNLIDGFRDADDEIYGENPVIGGAAFVDTLTNDFHLRADSPAIDSGISTDAPLTDYDGNTRPVNAIFDIGAYEYQFTCVEE